MTEYSAQQFTVTPDPGDPTAELSLRKLDQNLIPVAQIAFGNDSNTYLSFKTVVGGSMTEHMLIDAGGNIGIGAASAGEKLEVNGTVKATSFNGNLNGSQIIAGTIADARLPLSIARTADVDARFDPLTGHDHDGLDSKKIPGLSTAYFDNLNGASLTDLNGGQITTGTVAEARIDTAIVRTSALAASNGIATLDSNTLVVQNPANATAAPTASKIPIADASGKLAAGWGGNASTVATLDANSRLVQSANSLWDGTAGRSASPTPVANAIPVLNASAKFLGSITGDADTVDTFHASATPGQNVIPVGGISGKLANDVETVDGYHASATPTANTIPVGNTSGKLNSGWGGSASTLATLDASSLVVQDPANATATPAAGKICKWGSSASFSCSQLISTIATGTAPFVVSSTTEVANLKAATAATAATAVTATNANSLYDGSAYRTASLTPAPNTVPVTDGNGDLLVIPKYWSLRTSAADNYWSSVTYGNGLFVAVAFSGTGNRVMTSPDGIAWTARASAADNAWQSVAYGNDLFVAVASTGTGNRVMTSSNGVGWSIVGSPADNDWQSVAYGNGLFVAVANTGSGNRVMSSPNGFSWTIRNSAADNDWQSVIYGNGLFVAVASSGAGNRVMTSPDGIIWTLRASAADNQWTSVTFGNGIFVAVSNSGYGNRVMTSPDGITWTIRTSAADQNWISVTYGNGFFVGVASYGGAGNVVMTSPDGITWTIRPSADSGWTSVTYGNGLFVAVGFSGSATRVMTSRRILNW